MTRKYKPKGRPAGRHPKKRIQCSYCSTDIIAQFDGIRPHKTPGGITCPEGWKPWEDPYPARYEGIVDIGGERWYVRWLGPEFGEYMARSRGRKGWLALPLTPPYTTVPTHPGAYANALAAGLAREMQEPEDRVPGERQDPGGTPSGSTDHLAPDETGSMTWRGPTG